jgi:hypothetical protein
MMRSCGKASGQHTFEPLYHPFLTWMIVMLVWTTLPIPED